MEIGLPSKIAIGEKRSEDGMEMKKMPREKCWRRGENPASLEQLKGIRHALGLGTYK